MYKKAFTMAEVLITLGIIGIVAAMTLPSLIGNYKKRQTVVHLKKVYSILNQAFLESQAKNGEYKYWTDGFELGAEKYFELYWKPYLKYLHYCDTYQKCGYKEKSPWSKNQGGSLNYSVVVRNLRAPFILSDGTFVSISTGEGIEGEEFTNNIIFVDLNAGRLPNIAGVDLFIFTRSSQNTIEPAGYNAKIEDVESDCKTRGFYCAAQIMKSGWEIKENYPWR